jgi:hypothetical protein
MTASLETALQRISRHISTRCFTPSKQSLEAVRDAFIDTYGCMLIGASQPVARKTRKALLAGGQIHPGANAVIYGTDLHAPPASAAMANAIAGHALEFDDWEIPGRLCYRVRLSGIFQIPIVHAEIRDGGFRQDRCTPQSGVHQKGRQAGAV